MELKKKVERGMTLEVVLSEEDVETIIAGYNGANGRTRDGEALWETVRAKYGNPIIDVVVAHRVRRTP